MGKRPTLQMVADRAGVSRGTVDRVINRRSYVKNEVRARVLHAMQELGYLSPHEKHIQSIPAPPFPPLRLGVLLPNWSGHFRAEILRGIEAARTELRDFGIEVLLAECKTDIPGEVIELLEHLVSQGVKGVALCALNDLAIEEKIGMLAAQDIPVITFNSDLPHSLRVCYIGQNYEKSGRIAGELMSKCIPRHGKLLAMVGNLEFDGHRRRLEGFCTRLREIGFANEQIEVSETYNDYALTYRKVQEALARIPDLQGIYMANRSVAGCTEAVRAAGRTGKMHIIAHDVSESTKRLLQDGSIDLTISQDIYRQGYRPLILLRDLLQKGKQPAPDQSGANISIICAENL